jgi:hypothetical protein
MKLATYLRYLIESGFYRLIDLSRSTGIPACDLSNIVKNRRSCGERNLVKLVTGLKNDHQSSAVSHWLVDQIPPELMGLVHVIKANPGEVAVADDELPPDVDTLEGALVVLRAEGERNPAILKVLTNLAASFNRG